MRVGAEAQGSPRYQKTIQLGQLREAVVVAVYVLRGFPRPGSRDDKDTVGTVMVLLLPLHAKCALSRALRGSTALLPLVRMHPLALAESGWVWVGAGTRPAGLRTGRATPGLRRDAALTVRQNTRQGRGGRRSPEALLTCSEKIGIPAVLATSAMICARDGQRSGSQKLSPLN